MKFSFVVLIVIVIFFLDDSKTRTVEHKVMTTIISDLNTTRTSWWTRTFPIIENRTVTLRPNFHLRTTTLPIRISPIVRITIPIVIFSATLLFGFGLIIFAILTHGNGVSFLTRTNEHRLV